MFTLYDRAAGAFQDPKVGAVGGMVYRWRGHDIEFRFVAGPHLEHERGRPPCGGDLPTDFVAGLTAEEVDHDVGVAHEAAGVVEDERR